MRTDEPRALLQSERRHLGATRAELYVHAGPTAATQRDDTGELSGMDEHLADVASDTLEREVHLGLLHAVAADLAAVDAALERLAAGLYGRCEACGAAVGEARLGAVPAARLCLEHQDAAEFAAAALRGSIHAGADIDAAAHLDPLPGEHRTIVCAEVAALHLLPR